MSDDILERHPVQYASKHEGDPNAQGSLIHRESIDWKWPQSLSSWLRLLPTFQSVSTVYTEIQRAVGMA